jgi:hypothetical protein
MKDIYIQGIYHMFIISKNDILLHVTLETFHNSHAKTLVYFLTNSTHMYPEPQMCDCKLISITLTNEWYT